MAAQVIVQTAGNAHGYQQLAKTLPGILTRFFEKFPPGRPYATETQKPDRPDAVTQSTNDGQSAALKAVSPEDMLRASTPFSDPSYNPFLPWRNPITMRWRGPAYGLRRQAMLCKAADKHGVADLLPWSMKLPSVRLEKRQTAGLRVKGTGEGQKVKGHKWERTTKARLDKRKKAILEMPQLVRQWKQRGHGRGWKKYPK